MKAQFKGIPTFVGAKNVNLANFFSIQYRVVKAMMIPLLCIMSQLV